MLKTFYNLPLVSKLIIIYSGIFFTFTMLGSFFIYFQLKENFKVNMESELRNSTDTIMGMVKTSVKVSVISQLRSIAKSNRDIVNNFYEQYKQGLMSEDEAKKKAASVLLSQIVGKTGYIFCINSHSILVVHPNKALINADMSYHYLSKIQVKKKEGYIEYHWRNPGEKQERQKALYQVYFEPWDWIISATSYKEEFTELINVDTFKDHILSIHFGETGYPFIMDCDGTIIIHPKLQGHNVLKEKDIDRKYIVRKMCLEKSGKIIYYWKNPEEKFPRKKIVIFDYIPELKWFVASSGYIDEFYKPIVYVRNIIFLTLFFALLMMFFITIKISSSIVRPLQKLMKNFEIASDGNLSIRMNKTSEDEIGQLSSYFNNFMKQLEREITERIKIEEELKKAEKKYRSIFENSIEGIFQITFDGAFLIANPALAKILGYDNVKEILENINLGRDVYVEIEEFERLREKMKDDNNIQDFEFKAYKKDKTTIDALINVNVIRDDNQDIVYCEGILEDITQKKETNKLKVEKEAAEAANKAKSEFIANMSHELRTPLNAILGYAQLFKHDEELREDYKRGVNIIEKSGKHLLDLINDILNLSKIEAEKFELEKYSFNLKQLLTFIEEIIKVKIKDKGLYFITDYTADLPVYVIGDEKKLNQVLINLLGNAVKFTQNGGITFRVEKNGKNIKFSVEDTGIGIPEKNIEDIFSPFKQLGDHLKKTEGTGLGLTISKNFVKIMGGELQVESIYGKGSQFIFEIELPEYLHSNSSRITGEKEIAGYKGDRKKILIVDDKIENRLVLKDMLEKIGFELEEAENGLQCLEKVSQFKPDLIFMDLVMPEMNGYEATKKISENTLYNGIKIIALSASKLDDINGEMLKIGFDDYMIKPFLYNDLMSMLRKHLNLEFTYKEKSDFSLQEDFIEDTVILPSKDILRNLYALVEEGNLKVFKSELEKVKEDCSVFYNQVKGLLDCFEIIKIERFLKKFLEAC